MSNNEKIIYEFKRKDYIDFNIENFYSPANDKRYNEYLIKYVFKYYQDLKSINDYYIEKNLKGNNFLSGIFRNGNEVSCVIPKRQTLFDEMVSIHELTHLINELSENLNDDSKLKEVIPYFNEYNYLLSIHDFFAKQYEIFRLNTAIKAAKTIDSENYNTALAYIYAYKILEKRKDNYDIKTLNKINSAKNNAEKKLILKGYTI